MPRALSPGVHNQPWEKEGYISPLSANATLCRLMIRPSGEWSRAGMGYHSLMVRTSAIGIAESRFGRCSPMTWLRMQKHEKRPGARVRLLPAARSFSRLRDAAPGDSRKRHGVVTLHPDCSGPIRTKALGCIGPYRLWSPFPSARTDCKDPGPLGPLPALRPLSGAALLS